MRSCTARFFSSLPAVFAKSLRRTPSMNSIAKTRRVTNESKTEGITTSIPADNTAARARRWFSASTRKSNSAFVSAAMSRMMPPMSSNKSGEMKANTLPNKPAAYMSAVRLPCIFLCCTLITPWTSFSMPSGPGTRSVARCTCAIVALPSGGPGCKMTFFLQSLPNSSANVLSTSSCGSAGMASCSLVSSKWKASGMAVCTDKLCAILT
mmetsp:Transcript_20510/g.70969  ORF Transcript_20510/g.70969 Transcript_20510/m.70969 type:complete len:209 (+) Transcript_20510:2161-2787(+)